MNRSNAREYLMQMLYQMEIQNDYSEDAKNDFLISQIEDDSQNGFINSIYQAFAENKENIDKLIEDNSKGWKITRLAKVDLAVLRLSITEFIYLPEDIKTPVGVAINEAVKLAKKFGSDDSAKFINGILGQISRA